MQKYLPTTFISLHLFSIFTCPSLFPRSFSAGLGDDSCRHADLCSLLAATNWWQKPLVRTSATRGLISGIYEIIFASPWWECVISSTNSRFLSILVQASVWMGLMYSYSYHITNSSVLPLTCTCFTKTLFSVRSCISMMTSSNGDIFRVTGPLCGEFIDHRWIQFTILYCQPQHIIDTVWKNTVTYHKGPFYRLNNTWMHSQTWHGHEIDSTAPNFRPTIKKSFPFQNLLSSPAFNCIGRFPRRISY